LIAQGFPRKEGLDIDGNAIYSPGVDSSTIRLCLGHAAQHNLQIVIRSCPTDLLGSTLHETIDLRLPEGNWQNLDTWKRERPLVRLRKTLYGLKQSARSWFKDIYDFLVDNLGLTASVAAPGLVLGDGIIILVYVDDIMDLSATMGKLRTLCDALYRRFHAAPPNVASIPIGDHFQYVGLDVEIKNGCALINQSGYLAKVLEQFGTSHCRPRYTPMEEGLKFSLGVAGTGESELVDQSTYRQAIGCILYIALRSRPDIANAATTLGRYSSSPNSTHWTAVKHLPRYLQATAAASSCSSPTLFRPALVSDPMLTQSRRSRRRNARGKIDDRIYPICQRNPGPPEIEEADTRRAIHHGSSRANCISFGQKTSQLVPRFTF
jgi:hypothetical protein